MMLLVETALNVCTPTPQPEMTLRCHGCAPPTRLLSNAQYTPVAVARGLLVVPVGSVPVKQPSMALCGPPMPKEMPGSKPLMIRPRTIQPGAWVSNPLLLLVEVISMSRMALLPTASVFEDAPGWVYPSTMVGVPSERSAEST